MVPMMLSGSVALMCLLYCLQLFPTPVDRGSLDSPSANLYTECTITSLLHFSMSVVSSQEENVNMAASTLERTQVFLCYSHDDIDLTDPKDTYGKELSQLLSIYRNQGLAEIWSDRQIAPGAEYLKKIDEAIARTKVALLLLSSAFLASDFIQQYELPRLLAAEAAGYLTIIPLLFRLCPYKKSSGD